MKRPSPKAISLAINVLLVFVLLVRESQLQLQRFTVESEAPSWAAYAGAMQAIADFGNGVRRVYRPRLVKDLNLRPGFTGEVDEGAQIWTWDYYADWSDTSRLSAEAYASTYNRRMRNFINDPSTFKKSNPAATQPAQ